MKLNIKKIIINLLSLSVLLGACWGFVWEPSRLTAESYTLKIPRWPAPCANYRVVVASDIHAGAPYIGLKKIERLVAMIQAEKPDMVLLPGDFVIQEVLGGSFIAPEILAQHLKPLLQQTKVYAVLGNHDAWLDSQRVQTALESAGITVLEDHALEIIHGQCQFWLVGLSDFNEGKGEYAQAFADIPDNAATLAFTHSPDIFPDITESYSLMIAGHTHGGQVALPLLGRLVVPSKYGQRYAIGHIVENHRHLFVTPGIGTSILPVRFGVPPEISVLNLQAE